MNPSNKLYQSALILLALLFSMQVGLYVWMAPRGFDFTDESYYFLNYLYWSKLIGTSSFFGAYFGLPFRMLGESIPAVRIFSLLLLLASSAFFTRECFGHASRRDRYTSKTPWAFVVVGMAASLFYFGYLSTLRAPSYNLLALCSMLVATGLLFRILEERALFINVRLTIFIYGLAIGACGLGKATSGLLLVFVHVIFFAFTNRNWRTSHLIELVAFSLAGVGLNVVVLQLADPDWFKALIEGVKFSALDGTHNLTSTFNSLRWEIKRLVLGYLPWALGVAIVFSLLVRWLAPLMSIAVSALAVVLVTSCVIGLIWGPALVWMPLIGLTVLLLWSIEALGRKPFCIAWSDFRDMALMALLFVLPVAFSFGTNMPLLTHSQLAAVFPITAVLLQLNRLVRCGILAPPALIVCLAVLCVPTLVIQVRAASDVQYTYRQLSSLGAQALPVRLGAADNTLLVDATTRETLQSVIVAARGVGLTTGQAIMDFTGDGPGLIYALGAQPLGLAWLSGGYAGSQAIAAEVVNHLTAKELQNAWLLTSVNNPRAINNWKELLDTRLGPSHHELVSTVTYRAPYHWGIDAPDNISVQFWRPLRLENIEAPRR